MTPALAPALECRALTVAYGAEPVLRDVDLVVAPDEVVALLGPSGSGKSTLLAAVAGFVQPRSGEIALAGRLVASAGGSVPPERRAVGMVFQQYALWPHLSAVETVAYPLRRAGVPRADALRRAAALLDLMGIAGLAQRRPAALSGGQQQRVGIARALARDAALYLFDEPTAHLDMPLRAALLDEIASRRSAVGAAALYATHDAGEALAIADRLALLREGRLIQVGHPQEVYERPVDRWAARLTGAASVLEADVLAVGDGRALLRLAGGTLEVPVGPGPDTVALHGRHAVLVRPEWVRLGGALPGTVRRVAYRGAHTDALLDTPAGEVLVRRPGAPSVRRGDRVTWSPCRAWPVPR